MSLIEKWKERYQSYVFNPLWYDSTWEEIEADLRKVIDYEIKDIRGIASCGDDPLAQFVLMKQIKILRRLKQKIGLVDVGSLRSPTSNLSDGSEKEGEVASSSGFSPFSTKTPSERPGDEKG